jgi:hypothetical protein
MRRSSLSLFCDAVYDEAGSISMPALRCAIGAAVAFDVPPSELAEHRSLSRAVREHLFERIAPQAIPFKFWIPAYSMRG